MESELSNFKKKKNTSKIYCRPVCYVSDKLSELRNSFFHCIVFKIKFTSFKCYDISRLYGLRYLP